MSATFIQTLGIALLRQHEGTSQCQLEVLPCHLNGNDVVHGGVLFSLADTGMGYALLPDLDAQEMCATIEIKINYFRAVAGGLVECSSRLIHRGKTTAALESELRVDGVLVGKANGTFSIFPRKVRPASST